MMTEHEALILERIDNDLLRNHESLSQIKRRLGRIENMLTMIYRKEVRIMATLDDVSAAVAAETSVVASAVTLLTTLHQELQDALSSGDPAKVQAVLDGIEANKQALADAVAANTDTPPPTP